MDRTIALLAIIVAIGAVMLAVNFAVHYLEERHAADENMRWARRVEAERDEAIKERDEALKKLEQYS